MFSLLFCMHYKEHWHFRQTDHAQLLCPGWWRLLEQSVSPPGTKEYCTDSFLILGLMMLGPCGQFSEVTSFPMDNLDALPRWSPNSSPEFRMQLPSGPSLLPLLLRPICLRLYPQLVSRENYEDFQRWSNGKTWGHWLHSLPTGVTVPPFSLFPSHYEVSSTLSQQVLLATRCCLTKAY